LMTVNSGLTRTVTDASYSTTVAMGILLSGETNLTNALPDNTLTSVVITNFQYDAG
jgi:hypothetical protein